MTNKNIVFNPKVSIIIPVFNGSDFLDQAINSSLAQTYTNIEVVVINDGSNDDGTTEQIALSYGDQIRYFKKPNGGVASALNFGIEKMTGDYFSWLSHDDLYLTNKIEQQIRFLSLLPSGSISKTVVYSDFYTFTTDPEKTSPVIMPKVPPEYFRPWITIKTNLHGCTLLIPKSALLELGGFNEKLRTTQDYDLWFRMAQQYSFLYCPGLLVKARNHPGQGTIKMSSVVQAECNVLLSSFIGQLTPNERSYLSKKADSIAYATIAESFWQRGHFKAARMATRLMLSAFRQSSFRANMLSIMLIIKGVMMHYCIPLLKKGLPQYFRDQLKKWIAPN